MGAPIYQLLGGPSRANNRTHNICYDRIDFLTEPVRLARELMDSGIRAMKIWPFDGIAHETRGQYITADPITYQWRRTTVAAPMLAHTCRQI
jgi:L-alanine-DL-glutamate epimerase-like enolase superfamily enzyme